MQKMLFRFYIKLESLECEPLFFCAYKERKSKKIDDKIMFIRSECDNGMDRQI